MDAVILAAGVGKRMQGITRAYYKPLLRVNGVPLVRAAVKLAINAGVDVPVVVVAPQNADVIDQTLADLPATLIVQRTPDGPGDALRVGLQVRGPRASYRVLVLLADNVTTDEDVRNVIQFETAVGVNEIPRSDAGRYTRFDPDLNDWVEKVPITDLDGPPMECWVGPFVGWRDKMEPVLEEVWFNAKRDGVEALIGPHLGKFMCTELKSARVRVSSVDVGTVDAFAKARGWGREEEKS